MYSLFHHMTAAERELKRRIKITVWAYAYEICDNPLVSDAEYDSECRLIDLSIDTTRPDLDEFFRKEFSPHTGLWVRKHPELDYVKKLYERFYR